jgi:hypothetical protein
MPIVPILLLYAYQGGSEILGRVGLSERLAAMALVGVFGVIYSVAFLRAGEPEIAVGPAAKESTEMFAYVREHTPSDAVLVFRKPRVLALLGERAATIWPDGAAIGDSWCYFDEVGASYLIVTKPESGLETPGLFRALADAGAERVFENGQFVILKGLPGCDRPRGGEGAG